MGEFDETEAELSTEARWLARLKLQRVVFGAFAIVLVSLFALGLSAYRQMQREKAGADSAQVNAETMRAGAINERDKAEQRLGRVRDELDGTQRALALEKTRLVVHEARAGRMDRARELTADARKLGAPPWLPLAQHLTRDSAVRFSGSEYPDQPVLCGAVSGDRATVGVVRLTPKPALVIETYAMDTGAMLGAYPVDATGARGGVFLRLNYDAGRFYLRLPASSLSGDLGAGGVNESLDLPEAQAVVARPDLNEVYELVNGRVIMRRRIPGGGYTHEPVNTGVDGEVLALTPYREGIIFASNKSVYANASGGAPQLVHHHGDTPEHIVLRHAPGAVLAGSCTSEEICLVSVTSSGSTTVSATTPNEPFQSLRFLSDGSLAWVGQSGSVHVLDFTQSHARVLGDTVPTFIDRHPQGLIFTNRKGALNVCKDDSPVMLGAAWQVVPPDCDADARAHGFVVTAPDGEQFVFENGEWLTVPAGARVALTPNGPTWSGDSLRLPDGANVRASGSLVGAFADGGVLLLGSGGKLRYLGRRQGPGVLLPNELPPDAVCVSANARVVALRQRDAIYVTDFQSAPWAITHTLKAAPDLLALDAAGRHLAVAYGPTVSVRKLKGAEQFVRTSAPPSEIALLYEGTILVTLERSELVFYEVRSGLELLRAGNGVTSIHATRNSGLNIVVNGCMRRLDLTGEAQ